jgi:flagellar biosynthetic protein FlhB
MSEDHTQPPSKRRRQLAREQGQVVHSPELTAAAGWLVAVVILGAFGEDLKQAMVGLVRSSTIGPSAMATDPAGVASRVRGLVLVLCRPLGFVIFGFAAASLAAHQLQVRGLFTGRLIAPDPARLWKPGSGPGLGTRSGNVAWATVKAVVLVIVSAWVLRAGWGEAQRLSLLGTSDLVRAAGRSVLHLSGVLAGALLILGLTDYGLRYSRFEAMLRTTPQEQREDQRTMEGDVAVRAQRRRIARAWRSDTPDLLAGASLVLTGPGGLTLVLSGGPPPRQVAVRMSASGEAGKRLRRSAESVRIPQVESGPLARRLARQPAPSTPLSTERIAELAAIWPPQTAP